MSLESKGQIAFTARQWRYLYEIHCFFVDNDQFPSCVMLAAATGSTNNAASEMYARLERKGVVKLNKAGKYMRGEKWPFA